MKTIHWYFDFISPYAYLASQKLHRFSNDAELCAHPVLFAGLLKHWQTRGPAEMPPMRKFTYRQIAWLAKLHDIELNFPPIHPFNPLKLLRLCILLGSSPQVVDRLFRFVWLEGCSSDNEEHWRSLLQELSISDETLIQQTSVKAQLQESTRQAIDTGIFGVPGFVIDDEIFWGFDSMDFVQQFLNNPRLFSEPDMRAADSVGEGINRARQ